MQYYCTVHTTQFSRISARNREFSRNRFILFIWGPECVFFYPKDAPLRDYFSKLTFRFFKFVWQYPLGRTCRGRGGLGAARCFPWPHPGGRLPATPPTSTMGRFSFFPTNFDMLAVSFQSLFFFKINNLKIAQIIK